MTGRPVATDLALFPLQTVLFPGGLLNLKVFEARYLDLMADCLRERSTFGVVSLRRGTEVRQGAAKVEFEATGVRAELIEVDSTQPGILQVRCKGLGRFSIESRTQQDDGLWRAVTNELPDDETLAPTEALVGTVKGLANAIGALKSQGTEPFLGPYHFDDAGWVANRWCEILPIPMAAKQKLMELPDPIARLTLVDEYLRGKGVV
jgi:Lon protease-like protein